jgi:hypothetical protein
LEFLPETLDFIHVRCPSFFISKTSSVRRLLQHCCHSTDLPEKLLLEADIFVKAGRLNKPASNRPAFGANLVVAD